MENNYSYNSYPESGGSSPRSREIDFENPTPWEDQPNNTTTNSYKVKLMCSYGGKIHPRPHDNQLSYVGGETKILSVDRSIKFAALVTKLASVCDADICFKYQLPGEDLDALISVTNDDDLDHMMNEYDRLNRASPKPARLRLFLFPVQTQSPVITPTQSFGSTEGRSERERFVEALNSGPVHSSNPSPPVHGNADFLFGSEKGAVPMAGPVPVPVQKVRDLPVMDPVTRHHEPDADDRIQKHIQDLRRLRIAEDQFQQQQQQQQQQQNMYRQSEDNNNNLSGGYSGEYYVQRPSEKVVTTALPGSVPSPAQGYQISGGYAQATISADQQPVYMVPAQSSVYHAPMARPVTGPIGQTQGQGQGQPPAPSQGYYTVQRMPTEVYREQPVYNGMQPVAQVSQPIFPPQQQPAAQKVPTHGEQIRMNMIQSTAGMTDPGYAQVAYDNNLGRHVYYTAQGALVTQPPPLQQQQQQPQPHQVQLQPTTHQYQPVPATSANANQIQDGKVIGPTKISQGSI